MMTTYLHAYDDVGLDFKLEYQDRYNIIDTQIHTTQIYVERYEILKLSFP